MNARHPLPRRRAGAVTHVGDGDLADRLVDGRAARGELEALIDFSEDQHFDASVAEPGLLDRALALGARGFLAPDVGRAELAAVAAYTDGDAWLAALIERLETGG